MQLMTTIILEPELMVVIRGHSSEGLDHLFAQLHRRRHRLRVSAENVAEIDVEQLPGSEKNKSALFK